MPQVEEYQTLTVEGITYVGRRQIEAEYDLTRHKAHRLLVASGIEPLAYFNKLMYDTKKVNTYMESIYVFKKK
jgi:hypothetical protein